MSDYNQYPVGYDEALDQLVNDLPPAVAEALGNMIAARAEREALAAEDEKRGAEAIARDRRVAELRRELVELRKQPSYRSDVKTRIYQATLEIARLQKEARGE